MAKQIGVFLATAVLVYFAGPAGFSFLTAAAVTTAIVTAAIATVVGYVFRPKLGNLAGLTDRARMVRQPLTSRKIVYGYQRVSGPIVFITSTSNNKYLHLVIALADHEIQDYGSFYLNDEEVAINTGTGFVTNSQYIKNGNPLVRIKRYYGTDTQTADADLVSEVTEWTTDHRLQGIAYIYVRLEYDSTVFQQGIPNIAAAIVGKKVYDYRTTTTAYSFNPALVLADYLRSSRHGLGADASEIDTASFIAAANICDEAVELAYTPSARAQSYLGITSSGGTYYEKRYQCHGVVDTEKNPGEVIEELLTSMGGTLAYVGGKWTVKAAAYSSPAMTLTIDDLRGPISMQTKVPRNEVFNAVKGVFINPDAKWQPSDYPSITSATFEAEDGNRQIFVDLNLPYTVSSAMAQRLAKIGLYRSRQEITLNLACKLKAFDLKPGDTVNVTIDRYGFSSKVFEVADWKLAISNDEVGVDLQLREISSSVFDWNADESLFSEDNTTLPNSYDPPAALTNLTFTSTPRINADGTTVPINSLSWTQTSNIFVLSGGYIEAEFKLSSGSNWTALNQVEGDAVEIIIEGLQPGAQYDFRVRAVNINGIQSEWVSALSQTVSGDSTAPDAPTSLSATGAYRTVQLAWTNPTVADWFQTEVWRNTSNNSGTATRIGSVSASTYADSGLASGTTYYYWLKAKDFSGNTSGFSTGANATTDTESVTAATTPRSANGYIFYNLSSASAPSAPTASGYNFSTGAFSSLTANWSTSFSPPDPSTNPSTEAGSKFWAVSFRVQESTFGGAQTVTLSAVFNWQNFDGLVTYTNITTDSGTTFIDGANIKTGTIEADRIDVTDLFVENLKTSASGQRVEITKSNNDLRVYNSSGTKIAQIGGTGLGAVAKVDGTTLTGPAVYGDNSGAAPGVYGESNSGEGVYGLSSSGYGVYGTSSSNESVRGYATTAGGSNHGVRGLNANGNGSGQNTAGLIGAANGYDFYADGTGTNYGPFTGTHDALTDPQDTFEIGDIVIDEQIIERNGISSTISLVRNSTQANQPAALGVVCALPKPLSESHAAAYVEGFDEDGNQIMKPSYEIACAHYNIMAVNSVGEGQINVVGEGGNIQAGDLIVTSSSPGKGMKQADNVVRSITVAKARESASFSGNESKTIACIYLAG